MVSQRPHYCCPHGIYLKRPGSYIYEEFIPTGGTDIKVWSLYSFSMRDFFFFLPTSAKLTPTGSSNGRYTRLVPRTPMRRPGKVLWSMDACYGMLMERFAANIIDWTLWLTISNDGNYFKHHFFFFLLHHFHSISVVHLHGATAFNPASRKFAAPCC